MEKKWIRYINVFLIFVILFSTVPIQKAEALVGDISSFTVTKQTETSITLTWTAATGANYYVLKDGSTVIYEGKDLTFEAKNLAVNSTHNFYLHATDGTSTSMVKYRKAYTLAKTSIVNIRTQDSGRDVYIDFLCNNTTISNTDIGQYIWFQNSVTSGSQPYVNNLTTNQGLGKNYVTAYVRITDPNIEHNIQIDVYSTTNVIVCKQNITLNATLKSPKNLKVDNQTTNSVSLSWDAVQHATNYIVKDGPTTIYNGPNTSFVHSSLGGDTVRSYTIYATDGITNSTPTSPLSVRLNGRMPYTVNSTETSADIYFSCFNNEHNTGYMELIETGYGGIDFDNYQTNKMNNGGEAYFYVGGLQPGKKYFYEIGVKDSTNSFYICYEKVIIMTAPAQPMVSFYTYVFDTNQAFWSVSGNTTGATSYEIYRNGALVYSGVSSSFWDNDIDYGTPYTYEYYAVNAHGRSVPLVKNITYEQPIWASYTSDANSVTLDWEDYSGTITAWSLYDSEESYEYLYYDFSTEYTLTGLNPSTTYDFKIIGINEDEGIEYHSIISTSTIAPVSPPLKPATFTWDERGNSYIKLSWAASAGATSYVLKRDGVEIYNGSALSFVDTGRTPNTSYNYSVIARNAGGESTSISVLGLTSNSAVTGTATPTNAVTMNLNWSSSDVAITKYKVTQIQTNKLLVNMTSASSVNDTSLNPNTLYNYKIEGFNASNVKKYETIINGTTPVLSTPTFTNQMIEEGYLYTQWSGVTGASKYNLKIDGVLVQQTNSVSYFLTNGLIPGNTYHFEVEAVHVNGSKSAPLVFDTKFEVPFNVTYTNVTPTSVTVNWYSTNPALTSWYFYNDDSGEYYSEGDEINSYTITGLSPNMEYYLVLETSTPTAVAYRKYIHYTTPGGALNLQSPNAVSNFGTVNVDGTVKKINTNLDKVTIEDTRGTGEGWNLTVSASQFTQTTGVTPIKLPTNTLKLNGISSVNQIEGSSSLPNIMTGSPWIIDNGTIKIATAGTNVGMGKFELVFPANALELSIDTSKKVVDQNNLPTVYSNTINWVLSTGP